MAFSSKDLRTSGDKDGTCELNINGPEPAQLLKTLLKQSESHMLPVPGVNLPQNQLLPGYPYVSAAFSSGHGSHLQRYPVPPARLCIL